VNEEVEEETGRGIQGLDWIPATVCEAHPANILKETM